MRIYLIKKKLVLSLIIVFVLSGSAFADSVTVCNNSLERTDSLMILNDIMKLEQKMNIKTDDLVKKALDFEQVFSNGNHNPEDCHDVVLSNNLRVIKEQLEIIEKKVKRK